MATPEFPVQNRFPEEFFSTGELKSMLGIPYFQLSEPVQDPVQERQRAIIDRVDEIDTDNDEALSEYAKLYLAVLNTESNKHHFTGIPENVEEFKTYLKIDGNHGLAVFNKLGQIAGFAIIGDAERDQNDSWLNKFVIVNSLQNRKQEDGPKHVGKQALDKVVRWAFTTPMYDGRQRKSLHAAVIMEVPNHERMIHLLENSDFDGKMRLPEQAVIKIKGKDFDKPVERYYLRRKQWEMRQQLNMLQGTITDTN
ncbi:MAG: hypothetical protein COX79_01565 [Candidatus Levybacteria bacterium CG_4_10_14_0_2_um_filter_36_16]|nr:MAG: hypothetical protein AUK12_03145 [Candidatus Levybacteria bacterium CG2_30_37_29]PIR79020.1 MAG: hypothetical protein COU26_03395 [Candidatus Levybacteria bacterium CG10_big_fil_rev_8_21_14_0_10_36_30]PIZ97647.1 MAG: hypothetical protein COX79_01565 [Candidatus Levybacteria bacterium CG_4_10_14_0_2_um_filter_36_16]